MLLGLSLDRRTAATFLFAAFCSTQLRASCWNGSPCKPSDKPNPLDPNGFCVATPLISTDDIHITDDRLYAKINVHYALKSECGVQPNPRPFDRNAVEVYVTAKTGSGGVGSYKGDDPEHSDLNLGTILGKKLDGTPGPIIMKFLPDQSKPDDTKLETPDGGIPISSLLPAPDGNTKYLDVVVYATNGEHRPTGHAQFPIDAKTACYKANILPDGAIIQVGGITGHDAAFVQGVEYEMPNFILNGGPAEWSCFHGCQTINLYAVNSELVRASTPPPVLDSAMLPTKACFYLGEKFGVGIKSLLDKPYDIQKNIAVEVRDAKTHEPITGKELEGIWNGSQTNGGPTLTSWGPELFMPGKDIEVVPKYVPPVPVPPDPPGPTTGGGTCAGKPETVKLTVVGGDLEGGGYTTRDGKSAGYGCFQLTPDGVTEAYYYPTQTPYVRLKVPDNLKGLPLYYGPNGGATYLTDELRALGAFNDSDGGFSLPMPEKDVSICISYRKAEVMDIHPDFTASPGFEIAQVIASVGSCGSWPPPPADDKSHTLTISGGYLGEYDVPIWKYDGLNRAYIDHVEHHAAGERSAQLKELSGFYSLNRDQNVLGICQEYAFSSSPVNPDPDVGIWTDGLTVWGMPRQDSSIKLYLYQYQKVSEDHLPGDDGHWYWSLPKDYRWEQDVVGQPFREDCDNSDTRTSEGWCYACIYSIPNPDGAAPPSNGGPNDGGGNNQPPTSTFSLTVVGGAGAGNYKSGENVTIDLTLPSATQSLPIRFVGGTPDNPGISSDLSSTAKGSFQFDSSGNFLNKLAITMPGQNASIYIAYQQSQGLSWVQANSLSNSIPEQIDLSVPTGQWAGLAPTDPYKFLRVSAGIDAAPSFPPPPSPQNNPIAHLVSAREGTFTENGTATGAISREPYRWINRQWILDGLSNSWQMVGDYTKVTTGLFTSDNFYKGEVVNLVHRAPQECEQFTGWTLREGDDGQLFNSETPMFVVGESPAVLTANFAHIPNCGVIAPPDPGPGTPPPPTYTLQIFQGQIDGYYPVNDFGFTPLGVTKAQFHKGDTVMIHSTLVVPDGCNEPEWIFKAGGATSLKSYWVHGYEGLLVSMPDTNLAVTQVYTCGPVADPSPDVSPSPVDTSPSDSPNTALAPSSVDSPASVSAINFAAPMGLSRVGPTFSLDLLNAQTTVALANHCLSVHFYFDSSDLKIKVRSDGYDVHLPTLNPDELPALYIRGPNNSWKAVEGQNFNGSFVDACLSNSGDYQIFAAKKSSMPEEPNIVEAYVFPNPSKKSATLHVSARTGESIRVRIFDVSGDLVYENNDFTQPIVSGGQFSFEKELNLDSFKAGAYVGNVVVKNGSGESRKNFRFTVLK